MWNWRDALNCLAEPWRMRTGSMVSTSNSQGCDMRPIWPCMGLCMHGLCMGRAGYGPWKGHAGMSLPLMALSAMATEFSKGRSLFYDQTGWNWSLVERIDRGLQIDRVSIQLSQSYHLVRKRCFSQTKSEHRMAHSKSSRLRKAKCFQWRNIRGCQKPLQMLLLYWIAATEIYCRRTNC